ncbi:unnamed protein product [Hymenolepis diminuta]|uniref:BZIP domain-containing protein n=1 Tax=Hymenolepis diminuta TaxID=6216 RepID=A0A0R3SAU1_HYMDI|nr:unnamed protein product [Hymenolepis diminuta]VUZ51191.1 unnamed protein product [Hymenolepis diminuta]
MGRGDKRNLNPKQPLSKRKHISRRKQRERSKREKLRIVKELQRENGNVNVVVTNSTEENMTSGDVAPSTETESASIQTPSGFLFGSSGNEYDAVEIFPDYDIIDQSELTGFEEDAQISVSSSSSLNETVVAKSKSLQEIKPDSTSPVDVEEENERNENPTLFIVFGAAALILFVSLLQLNYNKFLETIIF